MRSFINIFLRITVYCEKMMDRSVILDLRWELSSFNRLDVIYGKYGVDRRVANVCQANFQWVFPKKIGSSAAHTGPTVTGRPLCAAS